MVILREAKLSDLLSLFNFLQNLEKDPSTRKFYRYLPCHTLSSKIRSFLTLLICLSLLRLRNSLIGKYYIAYIAYDNKHVVGFCHISVNLKTYIGVYGIAISKESVSYTHLTLPTN